MRWQGESETRRLTAIWTAGAAIAPLHGPIRPPGPDDWLSVHPEPGQTFQEYRESDPVLPTAQRTTLYVQPLGPFDPTRSATLESAVDLLRRFYGVPVRTLEHMGLAWVSHRARRLHPITGEEQVLTRSILDRLAQRRPADAVAVLALTTADLWPGRGWNFVFGQASLREGVGVWSLHRLGDPVAQAATVLRRTLKIAVHETGHMFGIRHCTRYACGMNGANHQEEADGQPLWFCAEDEMKVWWGFGADPVERYRRLVEFSEGHGLGREAAFWRVSQRAVGAASEVTGPKRGRADSDGSGLGGAGPHRRRAAR
jgi:archaemetzincin